ncbi:MAG: substrate-binding domain-containing protein, partial [Thermoplasmata archaeon]|nr:substrate-binding domain-containing protein [Thermoplasmata archaeon]
GSGGAGAPSASSTLSVIAAGTLGTPFASLASLLANSTPGVSAPLASQQYEGSLSVMAAVAQLGGTYDVVASADYHLIPQQLEPGFASWEAVFATSPEALVYDPSVAALSGINTTNWPQTVLSSGLPLGIANASTDPNGYNEIFVLQLEGVLQGGTTSSLYSHFFTTPVGSYAIADPTTTRVEQESNVASLIASHTIALFITYRSYAISHGLSYVDFAPQVGLGSTDSTDITYYAQASTTIQPASGTTVVHGAPVLFSVTVPHNAPNATLGLAFVHTVLSPAGQAILLADGLTPIFPGWCDQLAAAPPWLVPDLVALPGPLVLSP